MRTVPLQCPWILSGVMDVPSQSSGCCQREVGFSCSTPQSWGAGCSGFSLPPGEGGACCQLAEPCSVTFGECWYRQSFSYHFQRIPIPRMCCSLLLGLAGPTRPPLSVRVCLSQGALPGFPASSERARAGSPAPAEFRTVEASLPSTGRTAG